MGLKVELNEIVTAYRAGLNRTSVGLKAVNPDLFICDVSLPQSNQRGIESTNHLSATTAKEICLNRTSVGLKVNPQLEAQLRRALPQSNQRGIESASPPHQVLLGLRASIEPAWD